MHAASYESIVFSNRPCTGLLVFITEKLTPVDSLNGSDNVKPTYFDDKIAIKIAIKKVTKYKIFEGD
jgi:hypothetical protein